VTLALLLKCLPCITFRSAKEEYVKGLGFRVLGSRVPSIFWSAKEEKCSWCLCIGYFLSTALNPYEVLSLK
jgi:hypothetical protein